MDKLKDIIKKKIDPSVNSGSQAKKPPAYEWQDLALQVIDELNIPNFKRNAVFKVCKQKPRQLILWALNDTKELAEGGEKWKYFFKIIGQETKD